VKRDRLQCWQDWIAAIVCGLLFLTVEGIIQFWAVPGMRDYFRDWSGGESQLPHLNNVLTRFSEATVKYWPIFILTSILIVLLGAKIARRIGPAWLLCCVLIFLLAHTLLTLAASYLPLFNLVDVIQ